VKLTTHLHLLLRTRIILALFLCIRLLWLRLVALMHVRTSSGHPYIYLCSKVKVEIKLSMYLIKYHAMKAYILIY